MKKRLLFILVAGLFSLAGCSRSDQPAEDSNGKTEIVTTTSFLTDLAETIGGEHVAVTGLMGPGVDPHYYQPSTSDIIAMGEAEVVIYNGLSLEARFTEIFEHLGERDVLTLKAADGIADSSVLHETEEGDAQAVDPHIWFSVSRWKQVAQYVAEELSSHDPEHAEHYQENAEAYIKELEELSAYIEERVAEVPESSRYLVTAHDAFQYFGEEFNFKVVGLQGLNTKTEAGTGDISQMADFIVDRDIRAVFVESSVSPRSIEALIEATASREHELQNAGALYSDALGSPEDNTDSYTAMFKANIDTIVDGLTKAE
ncbi:manganese/zinc/iron transport system substrate-binding protein [Alkalibacterium putridalgicola]|uniref:Manganese transporter n=1 Tax=Alkalibacterium putridalgicola TaxID=426703 RepID=A0A1H7UQ77_9LACT|nr:zinc ABC transporter substrate-binding protein [Alkalibacterium putridalgicola]GEK88524.1 manganese transporter [Alkalibacterium putridalgicola]SEL98976.1 manganese/zinc/iron transport system substrate-binding protein [Alkalibacterium putridalgicola]